MSRYIHILAPSGRVSAATCRSFVLLLMMACGLLLTDASAATVKSKIVWVDGVPKLQVTLNPGAPLKDAKKTVTVNVVCINRRGDRVSGFNGRHTLNLNADGKAVTAAFPLLNKRTSKEQVFRTYIKEPRKGKVALATDHIRVNIYDKSLGLSYEELLYPMDPKGVLQGYGVRLIGKFGVRKAALALHFNGPRIGVAQAVSFQMHLLDGEGNRLLSFDKEIALEDEKTTDFETDVTPPTGSTGPYKISLRLDNETLKMAMLKEARFPYATVLVPVSGMEGDILADWHVPNSVSVPGSMKGYLRPKKPLNPMKLSNILFSSYQPFARPAFDSKQRHSGTRSLRIDYTQASGPVVIGSNIRLPGLPVRARLWVKGNGTNDELAIVWRDPCNFNEASYRRWMNQAQKTVCRLNFTDWRSFEVPVMGDGLLPLDPTSYYVGHSGQNVRRPLNAPIFVAALRVIPERPAKGAKPDPAPRSVWIDDLMVETQVSRSERLSLELRTDTSERLLHEKAELLISVGNGSGHEIRKGRVNVKALDVSGKTVYDETEVIRVPKGEFATKAIPLAKLAALRPRGPVTVVVTVSGPVAGQRVQGRVVLAHPTGAGVFWDFERAEHFNAQGPGPGADPVAGGADKTGHALPLTASKKKPASVLLHPALPGYVTAVEMQVFGDGNPVTLQAVFADSGSRDFDIYYNQYSSTPIRVDWKGWKTCRFPAPPLPPNYLASQGNPLYSPIYPLNLILTARTESEAQVAVRVDQIKVITHLPPEEELLTQLEYPDDTMMHVEGLPLRLVLTNFSAAPRNLTINFRLITPTGGRAAEGQRKVTVPAAERVYLALTEKLRRGFYSLRIDGLGERTFKADIMVPDRKRYFGKDVMARLADLRSLNSDLGFLQRRVNLDWDSAEPVPNLSLHDWFRKYAARNSETNAYEVVPVVGYSADWAGPEKELAVAAGTYRRDVGSYMQAPVRMADWTIFTRNVGREHAKEFKTWVFWQGPDMKESPVHLPQQKYQQMFGIFKRWISLYNPDARVVAGGFTYDRVLGYLNNMKEPHKLPFDHFEIRVNPGPASVEALQLEDFLEDLGTMLKLAETGRKAAITELDWATGEQITLLEQAAYHARAAILLHARGALPHRFGSVNSNRSRDGFGVLFQPRFGNSFTQPPRNIYIPKPAYFALLETRRALAELAFKQRVTIAERDPLANRAYLFKRKDGGVCAIVWSVRDTKTYQLPAAWANSVKASDVFGTAVDLKKTLPVGSVPLFLNFTSVPMDRVAYDLRNLRPVTTEGTHQLVLDFFSAEAASRKAVEFTAKGGEKTVHKTGRLFFGERVSDGFLKDVREERFVFTLAKPADVLMSRLWFLAKGKRTLKVSLNGAAPQAWDLAPSKEYPNPDEIYLPGPRRTAFVLRGCRSGRNELALFHDGPSMSGGFRLTVIKNGKVDLTACGALAYKDSGAPARAFKNASGGPLKLGKTVYSSGIGCLGATTMEYALNGQYSRFEVTVGIDASTRGRGTVGFRILVDGVEKAKSGPTTGMSRAKKLEVKDLAKAKRLLLIVDDGGDGAENDMANWVDPILYLKEKK